MTQGVKIVPSALLIWIVAGIAFPAAILGALIPAARIFAIGAGCLILLAALVDALLRGRTLDGIRLETPELARFFKDREGESLFRIHNSTRAARRLRIGIPSPEGLETTEEERDIQLPDSTNVSELSWKWMARRRGRYRVDACFLEAPSPAGLWTVRRRDPISLEIRVYPNLRRNEDLKALRRGAQGVHSIRQIGRGREFEKLREYVAGDGLDEIHWKASARRGHPITKVFQVERTQEIYVIIDASRLSARLSKNRTGEEAALERSIVAALLIGAAAERSGDLFGLVAFSNRVEAFTRARNGKSHYAACRDAIYQLQPRFVSPDFDEVATFLRLRLRRRALLFFLTSLDDPVLAENFARAMQLLARRHLVVAAMARPEWAKPLFHDADIGSPRDIYRQLAGHLGWKRLRETEAALGRIGIRLALIHPEHFGGELIGLYDEIKKRQLL